MRRVFLWLCIFSVGLVVAYARADDSEDDVKKLQGTWKAVYAEESGKGVKPANDLRIRFSKDVCVDLMDNETISTSTFKIDANANPKRLEIRITANKMSPESKGSRICQIYKFDGDRLLICSPSDLSLNRFPKDFSTTANDGKGVTTYERVK